MDVIESCSSSSDNEDKDEESMGVDASSDNVLDELEVNGRKWECMRPHLNVECPHKVAMHPCVKPSIASISMHTELQPIQYFESMFPNRLVSSILQWTNAPPLTTYKVIKPSEFWVFIAIHLSMSVVKHPTINDYWNEQDDGVL